MNGLQDRLVSESSIGSLRGVLAKRHRRKDGISSNRIVSWLHPDR
jgi:hypothetical protein